MQVIQDYLKTISGEDGGIDPKYELLVENFIKTAEGLAPNEALIIEQDNINTNNFSVVQDVPEYDRTQAGRPIVLISTPTQSYILILPMGTDIVGPGVSF